MTTPTGPEPNKSLSWFECPDYWLKSTELPHRPRRVPRRLSIHGDRGLANAEELRLLLTPPPEGEALRLPGATPLTEASPDGSVLRALIHRDLYLPQPVRERHVLAIGTTGAGKTQKLILPQLAADLAVPTRTIIALDAKGDGVLYRFLTALAQRHRPGQTVHRLNFKVPGRNTALWNPASRIRARSDARTIAYAVCANVQTGVASGGGTNEAFWFYSSVNLISDVLCALADDPRDTVSLARVKDILDKESYGLATWAEQHPHSKQFTVRYPAINRVLEGSSHQTQQCVVADAAMRLQLFGDEQIVQATCQANTLDLAGLIRSGGVLLLEVPEAHAPQLLPLTNLFVTQLFGVLLQEAMAQPSGRLAHFCTVVLDELGSACGRLPEFESRLSTLRSRGVAVTGAIQSIAQLESLYGKAAGPILDGFNSKLFFGGGLSLADSVYASALSGTMTVFSVTDLYSCEEGEVRRARSRTPVPRPVLLPAEIGAPRASYLLGSPCTVFVPDVPPFQVYLTPAYELEETRWALRAAESAVGNGRVVLERGK